MPAEQRPDNPTHPSATPTRTGLAHALRALRSWSGLTLQDLEALQPRLRVTTSSDYERALRFPGWEWVHDYVTTCLTHPKPPRRRLAPERLRAELALWQTAWSHAKNHPTPEPQPEPEPAPVAVTDPEAEPREHVEQADPEPPDEAADLAPTADTAQPAPLITPEPSSSPAVDESPAHGDFEVTDASDIDDHDTARPAGGNSSRRRGWLLAAAGVAVILAAGAAATATGVFERPPQTLPPVTAGPPSATNTAPQLPTQVPVHVVGNADDLPTTHGIDLDTGERLPQLTPGVDVSFSSRSTHLDSMGVRAFFAVLPQPVPQERTYCEQVTGWTRETYPDVYSLAEGRNICVKTDENRLAMLTITKRATLATGTISLRFITWE